MLATRKQSGMTPTGTFIIILLVGFGAYLALKVIPLYLEYFNVVSSINSLKDDPDLTNKSESQVRVLIRKRFEINDVKRVKAADVKITKSGGRVIIDVKYDAETSIIANIDLIVRFRKRKEF
jgi:hypothetical protein